MQLINLFIQDLKNFINFVNCIIQILILFYNLIYNILKFQYYVCINGAIAIDVIKSSIILNWTYYMIFCLIIIIMKMYSDKCNDIYKMYHYNYDNNNNTHKMVNFDIEICKLKHNILQNKINTEMKIILINYEYELSLYKIYDSILYEMYILTHKYNQLLINKEIDTYYNGRIC